MASSKAVPTFSAAAIEQVCRLLAETVTGTQIPNLIQPLKVHEEATARSDTKWKRLFNAVAAAQNRQQDGRPLLRLVIEIMAPVRYQTQAEFNMARTRLNASLLLSGFQVGEDRSLEHVRSAKTIEEAQQRASDLHGELAHRDVHPDILAFCRAELLQENYFHAVLEACNSVADKVRNLTGLEDDGSSLVDATARYLPDPGSP